MHVWHTRGHVGRHSRPSDNTCGAFQCPKISFHHIFGSVTKFSTCWSGVCSGGGLVCCRWTCFFFPFFSISFSENYNLTLLVVSISTLILFFLFFYLDSFVEILFVFNFIIESKFIKYYILQFGSYYLDF